VSGWRRTFPPAGHDSPPAEGIEVIPVVALRPSASAGADGPIVALSGEADATTAAELRETLATQLDTGARLVTVDASGLSFLDSASLRVLILAARALRGRHGTLVFTRPQPLVARLLEITGADRLLDVRELSGPWAITPCPGPTRRSWPDHGRVVSAAWETRRCRPSAWPRW
jgi:anti-anti-sigma factor